MTTPMSSAEPPRSTRNCAVFSSGKAGEKLSCTLPSAPLAAVNEAHIASFVHGLGVVRLGKHQVGEVRPIEDLLANRLIPDVPTPQLASVEPDLDASSAKGLANSLGGLLILRGVAQKHRVR